MLFLSAEGKNDTVIADTLGIQVSSVYIYRRRMLDKLGADNPAHAVVLAMQRGIIDRSVLDIAS